MKDIEMKATLKRTSVATTTDAAEGGAEAASLKNLRGAVKSIDALAQGGFGEIIAIAKLALAYLESAAGYQHPETVALALRAIWGKAEQIEDTINAEAEAVGCEYIDDDSRTRWEAQSAYLAQMRGEVTS